MSEDSTEESIFSMTLPVYYEDTDAGGVVYYANYLKFMERARTEWLRSLGFEQDELMKDPGIVFAVRSVEIDYHAAARFNDRLIVTAKTKKVGRASIVFAHEVILEKNNKVLVTGNVKVACVDFKKFKSCPLPLNIREVL